MSSDMNKRKYEFSVIYPSCLLEGGACVITDVGEGRVGCSESLLKCKGREPGRTIVGVGAELAEGFVRISCKTKCMYSKSVKNLVENIICVNALHLASHPRVSAVFRHAGRGLGAFRRGRINL